MNEFLVDESEDKIDVALEESPEDGFVTGVQMVGKCVEPRVDLHAPSERRRLQVNHTATRHLQWFINVDEQVSVSKKQ